MEVLQNLTQTERFLLDHLLNDSLLWTPSPENIPQIQAYTTEADILYYGGAAGGGKTDLLLGLALTAHRKSIIFRREYPQLREVIDRGEEILAGTGARFNTQSNRWTGIPGGRVLELGAVQHEKDREKFKGRPHDFLGFDEICDFTATQFRFLLAWARTTDPNQRVRVVCAGNPPIHASGEWVIQFWAPWLSETYPNPAKPAELRYFIVVNGRDIEVDGPDPVELDGEIHRPLSRTFIPAHLADNPYLSRTGYAATLQGLPEPLRSILLYGDFRVRRQDAPMQVIPTEWIRAAQARWANRPVPEVPLEAIGLDPSRGGADDCTFCKKYGNYFADIIAYPGTMIVDGPTVTALLFDEVLAPGEETHGATINVDVIGIGSSVYDLLQEMSEKEEFDFEVEPVNFASGSEETDIPGLLSFQNMRAEGYWRMREALDPTSGLDLALPLDDQVLADLAAPTWRVTARGILIESKKEIRKKLGRSPNYGDAIVLANMASSGVFFY